MGYQAKGKFQQLLNIYENKPKGNGPFPTIVLFMHAYGFDDPMKKVVDDLADNGYYALGVDSYLNGTFSFQNREEDSIFKSFDLLVMWLKNNEFVDMNKLGCIGFCMGGRHVYLANVFTDIFKACVSYYGFPHRGATEDVTPQNRIGDFTAPVFSIFGSEDKGIPMENVKEYQEASEKDLPHSSIVYEGAGHGFLNPYSPNHHKEAAEDAWKKTVEHFNKYLK
ncbi:MAG: dienelactone hydrolase family protein [Candidatus Heimdallarchaeota archaeon]|nr:dienelactone hydrolase family protein [Candidatus Heimdallarchaeota archaeon]